MGAGAEGKHPLLGAGFFFVAARATKGHIKAILVQGLFQPLGFHHIGVQGTAMVKRVDVLFNTLGVDMDNKVHANIPRHLVPKVIHGGKLPAGVYMHQGKGRRAGIKSLLRQVQHHRRIFAHRIEHHRVFGLGHHLTHDVNALGFEAVEV